MSYFTNLPVNNNFSITACYGQINKNLWKTHHKGVDIIGEDNIYSVCNGIVRVINYDKGWGNYITIEPNGYPEIRFIFAHLKNNSIKVKVGQKVTRKTIIGQMGDTGNVTGKHLHIEMRLNGVDVDITPHLRIENKVASNLNSKNYKVDEINCDNYLEELTKKKCDNCKKYKELLEKIRNLIYESELI